MKMTKNQIDMYKGIEIRGRYVPSYFSLLTEWLLSHGAPKWYVEKGDLQSFPWKATTGSICSDHKTKKEAQKSCNESNKSEGFPIKDLNANL